MSTKYMDLIEAFSIFSQYEGPQDLATDCDGAIISGPDPSIVSEFHIKRLKELGWNTQSYAKCFIYH